MPKEGRNLWEFRKPRAEAKLALIMPRRRNVGEAKSYIRILFYSYVEFLEVTLNNHGKYKTFQRFWRLVGILLFISRF